MKSLDINKMVYYLNPFRVLDHLSDIEQGLEDYFLFGGLGRVGLDIGTHSIKVAQVQETKQGAQLIKLGYKEISKLLAAPSGEVNDAAIIQSLSALWKEHNIQAKRVNLTISDSSLYSRQIRIPKISEEQVNVAIRQQAEKYIPFSIDEAIVDYQPIQSSSAESDQMDFFIVAAKKAMIYKYLSILKEVNLAPNVMDVSFFSVAKRLVGLYSKGPEHILPVIDMGAHSTTVLIFRGAQLKFVRNFELAGDHFSEAISKGLQMEREQAERTKRNSSLYSSQEPASQSQQNINVHLEPVLDDLIAQIHKCFAYCERDFLMENIEKIILCGGGAKLKGLDRYLSENLGATFEIANPLSGLVVDQETIKTPFIQEHASMMSAAIGAALKAPVKR
ncbi:MAG TPA: type IV pilus assembly protein PilM [Candidatus Omnitrophota bacterium]|nr:type IV pilus assembly protein PilM [Candidatus Omnitrophota bacterium]